MYLYELLNIDPHKTKVHLAAWNGSDDPLEVFFDGKFKIWQECQTKRNFGRELILSLIRLDNAERWLFAGIYQSKGIKKQSEDGRLYYYDTDPLAVNESLIGRLVVTYRRKGRNSYPNGESLLDDATMHAILPERMAFSEFKDFKHVRLSRSEFELLFKHEYPSWKSALSSVAGVYLISDKLTGKQYVGSAYGTGGFWARWMTYYSTYHGNNTEFAALFSHTGAEAFKLFQYSILEVCDIDLSKEAVIEIESRWKDKLLTRSFGFNRN